MRKILIGLIVITLILILLGIASDKKEVEVSTSTKTENTTVPINSDTTRAFYMGFSTWPPDFNEQAIEKSYALINANSDLRLVHLDFGVPWVEMAKGDKLPKRILDSFNYTKSKTNKKKIFIAITPLNTMRDGLALYAGEAGDNQPLPSEWKDLKLNDEMVKKAYLAYVKNIIDYWNPNYLAIGIEVNILTNNNSNLWNEYIDLHKYIYREIKSSYPSIQVLASIQAEHFKGITDEAKGKSETQRQVLIDLGPYLDIVGISAYPYVFKNNKFDEKYFDDFKFLNKPLAIAETGWSSKDIKFGWATVKGSDQDQINYIQTLMKMGNKDKYVFIINWVNVDYVKLLEKLPEAPDWTRVWLYNGFWDENFNPKPVLKVWQNYLNLKKV